MSTQPIMTWGMIESEIPFFDETTDNIAGIQREMFGKKINAFITLNKNRVIFDPLLILSAENEIGDATVSQSEANIFLITITLANKEVHTWSVNTSHVVKAPGIFAYIAKQRS